MFVTVLSLILVCAAGTLANPLVFHQFPEAHAWASAAKEVSEEQEAGGPPMPCCLPNAFTAAQGGHATVTAKNETVFITIFSTFAVDKNQMKVAENRTTIVHSDPPRRHEISIVEDQMQHKIYFVNRAKNCAVSHAVKDHTWNLCVPSDSMYLTSFIVGAGMSTKGVFGNVFGWKVNTQNNTGHESVGVSSMDCSPLSRNFAGTFNDETVYFSSGFFNFTVGVKDQSVFSVPPACFLEDAMEMATSMVAIEKYVKWIPSALHF